MKYSVICIVIIILHISVLSAQDLALPRNTNAPTFSFPSAFSLTNLRMSQSMSFSTTYNSGTKNAYYLSNFCNSFQLPLSDKLNLALDLNFVNYGKFGSNDPMISSKNTKILPNFSLEYAPTENMRFHIEYNSFPTYYHSFR